MAAFQGYCIIMTMSVLQEAEKRLYFFECKQCKIITFVDFKQVANEKCIFFLKTKTILIEARRKFYEEKIKREEKKEHRMPLEE